MSEKVIIENRTDLTIFDAMELVTHVIKHGRISNNGRQYCYYTRLGFNGSVYGVYTDLNKKSDKFIVVKDRN